MAAPRGMVRAVRPWGDVRVSMDQHYPLARALLKQRDTPMASRSRSRELIISRLAGAVPPFKARWAAYRTSINYATDGPEIHILLLSEQIAGLAAEGQWATLTGFFEALEVYASRRRLHVARSVAVGLLIDLIDSLELADADLRPFFDHLGPSTRKAWREAYRDGHGGEEWLD